MPKKAQAVSIQVTARQSRSDTDVHGRAVGPYKQHMFGYMNLYFSSPAIVLDHCDHTDVHFSESVNGLVIKFTSQVSFNNAQRTWSVDPGLLLVTYTPGCGDYGSGRRCYFQVSELDIDLDALTISAKGSPVSLDDVIHEGHTEWGLYTPDATAPMASTTSANPVENNSFGPSTDNCTGPVDTKYGLPTSCLGPEFDLFLDTGLGFVDIESTNFKDFVNTLAPS